MWRQSGSKREQVHRRLESPRSLEDLDLEKTAAKSSYYVHEHCGEQQTNDPVITNTKHDTTTIKDLPAYSSLNLGMYE